MAESDSGDGRIPELTVELLDHFLERLRETGAPVGGLLSPGLDPEQVQEQLSRIGADVPPEVMCLFTWRNGAPAERFAERFFGLFQLAPLSELVDHHFVAREALEEIQAEAGMTMWSPTWLPLVLTYDGSDVFTDTAEGGPLSPVQHIDYTRDMANTRARSIGELITWWTEALEERVLRFNGSSWDLDREALDERHPERALSQLI